MRIQSTAIKETPSGFHVELFLGDTPDANAQQNGLALVVQLSVTDRYPRLAELQKAALQSAQIMITNEIQRLEQAQLGTS